MSAPKLKTLITSWLKFWLPLVMLAWLPTMTDFLENRYQVAAVDLVLPLLLQIATATVVTLAFYRLFRRDRLAGYVAAILAVLVLAYGYDGRLSAIYPLFQALSPLSDLGKQEAPVFSLIFAGLVLVASYWSGRGIAALAKRRGWKAQDITAGLVVAITVTFLFQFLPLINDLRVEWPQFSYRPIVPAELASAKAASKPDIYYIVLDDYANQQVLSSQLGFDNAAFTQWLQANHYFVNPNADSNYPYTTMSIASTLNAGYNTDIINRFVAASRQTIVPYHQAVQNAGVIQQLKTMGYKYDLIGSWYDASNQSPLADKTFQPDGQLVLMGHDFSVNNFTKLEITQSFWWRLWFGQFSFRIGHLQLFKYTTKSYDQLALTGLQNLKDLASQPAGGRFIFAHILIPHVPYVFNADGSLTLNSDSNNVGNTIERKYADQIQFINEQIKPILTSIDQNSNGQAAVVLQSDEGANPIEFNHHNFDYKGSDDELNNNSMLGWTDQDLAMKYGTLAAYHLPGVSDQNLAAADPVNIFRLVFNSYFGTNLPYLPQCYYAYPGGRAQPFVFADVTKRLAGQANPACSADSR